MLSTDELYRIKWTSLMESDSKEQYLLECNQYGLRQKGLESLKDNGETERKEGNLVCSGTRKAWNRMCVKVEGREGELGK